MVCLPDGVGRALLRAVKQVDGKRLQYRESVDAAPYLPGSKGQRDAPLEAQTMKNKAPERIDLWPAYGLTVIVLVVLAVLIWIAAKPLGSF